MRKMGDAIEKIADSFWLTDCHPKPVAQTELLAALLDQNGHYVSQKVVELMALAGVAPQNGVALVLKPPGAIGGQEPPGGVVRGDDEHTVLFYREYASYPWVLATTEEQGALAESERVTGPLRSACERWGRKSEFSGTIFPWGSSSRHDPVGHQAELFSQGRVQGVAAVAAGRLGARVLGIVETRWMFDITSSSAARSRRAPSVASQRRRRSP